MLFLTLILSFFQTLIPNHSADSSVVIIKNIAIDGNKKTKERIIFRELDFKVNDTLNIRVLNETLERNKRKLVNTNLFVSVACKATHLSENEIEVQIHLQEQWFLMPYPLFQLADRNFNEWWSRGRDFNRTVYGLDINHTNFRGRAEKLFFHVENGFTRRFDFSYRIPYIDKAQKTGIGVLFSYGTSKNVAYRSFNDTLNYARDDKKSLKNRYLAAASIKKRFHFYDNHTVELNFVKNIVEDTIIKLNPNYFQFNELEQQYFSLGYFFTYDNRDNVSYPLLGKRFDFGIKKIGLSNKDDLNYLETGIGLSYHHQLYKKLYLGHTIKGRFSSQTANIYNNNRGLGYGNDLVRGFELYVIDGNAHFLSRNTLRYELLNKTLHLKFLKYKQINKIPLAIYPNYSFDIGYIQNKNSEINYSKLANSTLYSYGFGLDLVTYYNVVARFNYMSNSLNQTRFVFNIGREF